MKKIYLFLLVGLGFVSFGFFDSKIDDWKQGVKTIGIRVHMDVPKLKVYYARSKFFGLARGNKDLLQKDQNTTDRMDLALGDFSFPTVIFEDFKQSIERRSDFKVVSEEDFATTPPDFIFDVNVLYYGLIQKGFDPLPRGFFQWKVFGRRPDQEKPVWAFSRKKLSPAKNLRKWLSNNADVLKGEFRAHILFSVQDLLYETRIRMRRLGIPNNKG